MSRQHDYRVEVTWTGNRGTGTSGYRDYARDHEVRAETKQHLLLGSSDRTFHGDASRWNPEELLLSALSQCHLLAYLHLCAVHGVVVLSYRDRAEGTMVTDAGGNGRFTAAVLHPAVEIAAGSDPELALRLHDEAHHACFIANSVNFDVGHAASIRTAS